MKKFPKKVREELNKLKKGYWIVNISGHKRNYISLSITEDLSRDGSLVPYEASISWKNKYGKISDIIVDNDPEKGRIYKKFSDEEKEEMEINARAAGQALARAVIYETLNRR